MPDPLLYDKTRRYWTLQLSCWGIYIIYVAWGVFYNFFKLSALNASILGFIDFSVFILTTHIYRLIVRKWDIESLRLYKFLMYPVLGNILISIVVSILNIFLFNYFGAFKQYTNTESLVILVLLLFQFFDTFRFVMPWFIFYHGIKFAEKAIQNERSKVEAQMQLKVAELDNLRNQLNPHFLFNSLNSIQSLTLSDPRMAREATLKLSDILRISLTYKDLLVISFEEELNLVKDYLSLEKIRFESRLNYSFDIQKGIITALIPPMSLQLLAENAVKHGIGKSKNGGEIVIFAHKKNNVLVFGVRNTGNLMGKIEKNKRKGIGLDNLRQRLVLNYKTEDCFQIFEDKNIVTSEIRIPFELQEK
jgi:sensor histidine kinase YesM